MPLTSKQVAQALTNLEARELVSCYSHRTRFDPQIKGHRIEIVYDDENGKQKVAISMVCRDKRLLGRYERMMRGHLTRYRNRTLPLFDSAA